MGGGAGKRWVSFLRAPIGPRSMTQISIYQSGMRFDLVHVIVSKNKEKNLTSSILPCSSRRLFCLSDATASIHITHSVLCFFGVFAHRTGEYWYTSM